MKYIQGEQCKHKCKFTADVKLFHIHSLKEPASITFVVDKAALVGDNEWLLSMYGRNFDFYSNQALTKLVIKQLLGSLWSSLKVLSSTSRGINYSWLFKTYSALYLTRKLRILHVLSCLSKIIVRFEIK